MPNAAGPYGRLLARRSPTTDPAAEALVERAWEVALRRRTVTELAVAGAALAEWAWLTGRADRVEDVVRAWRPHAARPTAAPAWAEVLRYARRACLAITAVPDGAGPWTPGLRGDWRAAADGWARLGDPYERALELAESGEAGPTVEALHTLENLGAAAAARHVRKEWVVAATALVGFVRELVAAKRAHPADDLLSALGATRDGADRLTEDELTSMVFLLLVAGHETTVNLIGNGVHTLLTHPDRLALLRAEPERLPDTIEELLRFEGPVQVATFRWTTEPVRIGDTLIPAGEFVVPGLLAANRDPARIADPDTFEPTRGSDVGGGMGVAHLAFGHGAHHCLGASLARLEGRIALGSLLARVPDLRLAVPFADLRTRGRADARPGRASRHREPPASLSP